MSGAKVVFDQRGTRSKLLCLHSIQPWIVIITQNNVIEMWNYDSNFLFKAFNSITLDDMKPTDIRDVIFFDKSTSKPLSTIQNQLLIVRKSHKNWIIFATDKKIFFYDYITDVFRNIPQRELDTKGVRKVQQISDQTICVGTSDGALRIIKVSDGNQFITLKSFKGFYSKPITWIIAYKQSQYQRPRIIAASQDSMMACWNVESNLQTPSFRFLMKKKTSDNTSNDGQQIISMKYERSTFRLLTLTEQYITVWSTFSGHELKRLRNVHLLKDVEFFSQLNFPIDSFLSHSRGQDIYISTIMLDVKQAGSVTPNFDAHNLINLRGIFNDSGATRLLSINIVPPYPWILCLNTTSGIIFLQVNRVITQTIASHDLFTTKLTLANSKQFYADRVLNTSSITPHKIQSMYFRQNQYYNFFYLTHQKHFILLKLIQVKLADMSFMTSQFNLMDLYSNQLLNERVQIKVSFDGKLLALVSTVTQYFEVYLVDNGKGFQNIQGSNRIDFYSKFKKISSGMCACFQWHQYKQQFCIIAPVNSKGIFVNYKKGNKGMQPDNKIQGYQFVIFQLKNQQLQIFFKKSIKTKHKRCFSGLFFGCSTIPTSVQADQLLTKDQERVQFIQTCQGTVKVFDPFIHTPEQMYWNYCGTVMIACYDTYFIIYKVGQDGLMGYLRKIQKIIVYGYFWQKIFFYVTPTTIQCIQIINTDVIQITIAINNPRSQDSLAPQFDIFDPLYLDTVDSAPLEKPLGQLKILNITNVHLTLVNQVGQITFLSLQTNPYLIFLMQIISGSFKYSKYIYQNCDDKILPMLDDIIKQYGVLHTDFLTK